MQFAAEFQQNQPAYQGRFQANQLHEGIRIFFHGRRGEHLDGRFAGALHAGKGDAPGFVRILNERLLAIPDRPGNNRIDNLRNIVEDGRVSVLFIVPGVGETLRVNGTATISADPELLASFAVQGRLPRSVILVQVQTVYFHCSKALVRSKLWERGAQENKPAVPTAGKILQHISGGAFDGDAYDRELPERLKTTLY